MAAATIMELANGVAQFLADYKAEIDLCPDYELRNMKERRVVVVPVAKGVTIESRAADEYTHTLNIGVIHKCRSVADIEPLIALTEAIGLKLMRATVCGETCINIAWNPLYAHEEIRTKGQFTGVIAATFKEMTA